LKEYKSIRAAEKEEKAKEKAEFEHATNPMEVIRKKAYWDHMNAAKLIIKKSEEGVLKANASAYDNRGIIVQENEKKVKDADAKAEDA